jgi:hypothetical protein
MGTLVLALLMGCLLWSGVLASSTPAKVSDLGASTHTLVGGIAGGQILYRLAPTARERQLSAIQTNGLRFVRTDLFWAEVEPRPGVFRWVQADAFMAALARHHLDWLIILDYSSPWAARQPNLQTSPPGKNVYYLEYARAVARRYGYGGVFWKEHSRLPKYPVTAFEVWNEPDSSTFWTPTPEPAAYARLYVATRRILHEVDPGVEVISGGLAAYPVQASYYFIHAMFSAVPSLRKELDAFGWHAYAPNAATAIERIRTVRAILRAEGAGQVPIEITEFGWPTSGIDAVSEAVRAEDLSTFVHAVASSGCGVGIMSAYDWLTSEENAADYQDWFGLANLNDTVKPAGLAYTSAVQAAANETETGSC